MKFNLFLLWGFLAFASCTASASDSERANYLDALLRDSVPLYEDAEVCGRVTQVGERVAAASQSKHRFRFSVLNSSEAMSFSAPDGRIYITTGLLERLISEDELAGMLGHEIAHVNERHLLKTEAGARNKKIWRVVMYVSMTAASAYFSAAVQNALGDSLAYPSAVGADGSVLINNSAAVAIGEMAGIVAFMATGAAGETMLQYYFRGYKDEYEFEADRLAVRYAEAAGYRAGAFLQALERLSGSMDDSSARKAALLPVQRKLMVTRLQELKRR